MSEVETTEETEASGVIEVDAHDVPETVVDWDAEDVEACDIVCWSDAVIGEEDGDMVLSCDAEIFGVNVSAEDDDICKDTVDATVADANAEMVGESLDDPPEIGDRVGAKEFDANRVADSEDVPVTANGVIDSVSMLDCVNIGAAVAENVVISELDTLGMDDTEDLRLTDASGDWL